MRKHTDSALSAPENTGHPTRDHIVATTAIDPYPFPSELTTPAGREEIESVVRSVRCSAREWQSSDPARAHLKIVLAKWLEVYC